MGQWTVDDAGRKKLKHWKWKLGKKKRTKNSGVTKGKPGRKSWYFRMTGRLTGVYGRGKGHF